MVLRSERLWEEEYASMGRGIGSVYHTTGGSEQNSWDLECRRRGRMENELIHQIRESDTMQVSVLHSTRVLVICTYIHIYVLYYVVL